MRFGAAVSVTGIAAQPVEITIFLCKGERPYVSHSCIVFVEVGAHYFNLCAN